MLEPCDGGDPRHGQWPPSRGARRAEPPPARHVVNENARVLEATALLRKPALAEFEPLLAAGAVGARMTGAGFGGCALALVPADRLQANRMCP